MLENQDKNYYSSFNLAKKWQLVPMKLISRNCLNDTVRASLNY